MTDTAAPTDGQARSPAVVAVFGLVLASLIGFLPSSGRPPLTILIVVLLFGTAVGLPLLARLVLHRHPAALFAAAFLAWATVSAIASGEPLTWTGEYFTGTGAVFCAGLVGYWAVGRLLPEGAVGAVAVGFLAGAAVNALVAVLQGVVDLSSSDIYLYDDRSTGFIGNPVFLGAMCAAAVALLPLAARRSLWLAAALAALFGAATQMSGSRNSIVVIALASVWAAHRIGTRRGAAILIAVVVGLAAGNALQGNAETTASARIQVSGGLAPRLQNWKSGVDAAFERPLVGYGPGRWRAATSARRTPALARAVGPDRLYADAHNLVVEYAGTTGLVGAALFLAWLVLVALGSRRPAQPDLAVAAVALLLYHLVEPQHLTLTPLMVLLAAAAAPRLSLRPAARGFVAAPVALAVVAALLAARVVTGDVVYRSANLDFSLSGMERAADLLRPWPNPVNAEARIHAFRARTEKDPAELERALATARDARRLEPDNPIQSVNVAAFLSQLGRHEESAREYVRAIEADPWSRLALTGRAGEMAKLGRTAQAAACRTASRVEDHSDAQLEEAHRRCLAGNAKRERP